MTAKTSEWRPGPTVCRCCLAEGCYKDISTEYFWMGKREVYAEMLSDTLNLSISYSKSGGPNSNSRLICEPCISRLRDASDFKRQVLECEKTFMQHLDPGSSSVQQEIELSLEEVKVEQVKKEKALSEDDDFDDRVDFVVENDDSDDDLDDQPLMKLATKVPKKEVDLLELLDNSQVTVKRKATASTAKAKAPPAKKAKKREIVIKPSASKATASSAPKPEKKKKELSSSCTEKQERSNAKTMIQYSTVYPFKLPASKMVCVYCDEECDEPFLFRQHMKDSHKTGSNLTSAIYNRFMKVDCTELNCRVCSHSFDALQPLAEHLKSAHRLSLELNTGLGLVPFVLPNNQWICTLCKGKFSTLRLLSKHMSMAHFSAVTCEECGKGFANARTLKLHVETTHKKIRKCLKCKQIFATAAEKGQHVKSSPSCWLTVCQLCNIRFLAHYQKEAHMKDVHNSLAKNRTCVECGETFESINKYRVHFRVTHTDNKFSCSICPAAFVTNKKLARHMLTHTKEKPIPCPVCDKAFGTQSSLNQHMWAHKEEKRFKCKSCNKQFNQKVCWVAHMKNYHPSLEVSE